MIGLIAMIVAPVLLAVFTLVSAYVMRFSYPNSGIQFDYALFTLYVVVSLASGGAI